MSASAARSSLPATLPQTMLAIEIREPGPPDVLQPCRRPLPGVHPGEVLVRVAAAGVNRPDCVQRAGGYPPPPGVTDIPGLEIAGTVVATSAESEAARPWLKVGSRICALVAGGGYAEYCAVPAVQCLPVPDGFSFSEAAAVPETFFTVWTNVFERGALKAGESLLVHGGASGIGTTAIQLGAALGARVFATAGNDDKLALCERLGAVRAVNYRTEKFVDVLLEQTAGQGVDVILDIVGGPYLAGNLKLLKEDGRLVYVAALGGARAELNIALVFVKRLTVTGSTLRNRSPDEKGRIARVLEQHVWPLLASRTVVPVIQQVLPLEAAAEAHRILEANQAMGKLLLRVADET